MAPELGPELGVDLVGEPWKDYHDLGDDDWATLKPFLPETMEEDWALISGILWVFTTRGIWKDMPERFGRFNTARGRVTKLRSLELWEPLLAESQRKRRHRHRFYDAYNAGGPKQRASANNGPIFTD